MLSSSLQEYLYQILSNKLGLKISSLQLHSIGGGSINDTYQVKMNSNRKLFLKLNSIAKYPRLFEKEKNGLEFLDKQKIIHVPAVISCEEIDNYQILLLEWIEGGLKSGDFWKQFGEKLARLHQRTWPNKDGGTLFGLDEDNYMGALVQVNHPTDTWIDFFSRYRLQPQIKLATQKGFLQTKHLSAFENLHPRLQEIFGEENSSLVHGDLWSGNFMCGQGSEPVLIDPAIYFGHRSMDLAMTTLFGGFDRTFYESYNYHFPFPKNYHAQWDICNLYPLLIHLNLFGAGYLGQVESILERFRY